ncbi:MAG: hypothetical protein U1D55_00305 [Phycisphaerae bacterium]
MFEMSVIAPPGSAPATKQSTASDELNVPPPLKPKLSQVSTPAPVSVEPLKTLTIDAEAAVSTDTTTDEPPPNVYPMMTPSAGPGIPRPDPQAG